MSKKIFYTMFVVLCAGTLLAQSTPPANGTPSPTRPMRRGGESCFHQAGIDQSVMEQIHTISREARSKIETICSNSSLTAQQKHEQTKEIREQAMQKRDGLMTADQQKALNTCQQARSGNHPSGGGTHEGMGGGGGGMHEGMGAGCGEMPGGGHSGGAASRPSGNGSGSAPPANQ
jgi:hypothetical protein